jgi:two-component system chemotaxis sensor kinase CheA
MILDPNGIARAAGVGLDAATEEERRNAPASIGMRSNAHTSLLLFRAGDGGPKAVPLGLVARLEDIPGERIEMSGMTPVVQYRGALMPIVPISGHWMAPEGGARQPVLVFTENDRAMGLAVEEILDVIEEKLEIEPGTGRPGFIGSAVIAGRVTEVIDTAYWLSQAGDDWFRVAPSARRDAARPRLLLVEDSAFFRHLVVPALSAAGYEVTAVESAVAAMRVREEGVPFDAIVSDIEMPDMDGLAFARAVRSGGAWSEAPLIALSSRAEPADVARGREAGFTDYVAKYDREALLRSLSECLSAPIQA